MTPLYLSPWSIFCLPLCTFTLLLWTIPNTFYQHVFKTFSIKNFTKNWNIESTLLPVPPINLTLFLSFSLSLSFLLSTFILVTRSLSKLSILRNIQICFLYRKTFFIFENLLTCEFSHFHRGMFRRKGGGLKTKEQG